MSVVPSLYYPYYVPPDRWVRAYLLFFDTIRTIVPKNIQFPIRKETRELFERIDGNCYDPLRISPSDFKPSAEDINVLEKGFEEIQKGRIERGALYENILFGEKGQQVQGWVIPTHTSKVPWEIYELLEIYELIGKTKTGATVDLSFSGEDYHAVDKEACCLLMALHADRIARQKALQSITNVNVCFSLNAGRHFQPTTPRNAQGSLAAHIIALSVPANISTMPINDYLEVRRQFSDLRHVFQGCVNKLFDEALLADVSDPEILREKVLETAVAFHREARILKKKREERGGTKDLLFTLGGIFSIASSIFPKIAIPNAIGNYMITTYDRFQKKPLTNNMSRCQLFVADLKKELATDDDIRRFM